MKFFYSIFFLIISCSLFGQDYRVVNNEIKTVKEISFKDKTATLLPEGNEVLVIIKKYLDEKSYISQLRIEGHVNIFGDALKDQRLSEERAMAVYNKLVSLGVDCKRLLVAAFGNTKPETDPTVNERSANTSIRFVNASIRGRFIGGMSADGGGKLLMPVCK